MGMISISNNCSNCLKIRAVTLHPKFGVYHADVGPSSQLSGLYSTLDKTAIALVDLLGPLVLKCAGEGACTFKVWLLVVHEPLTGWSSLHLLRDQSTAAVFETLVVH